MCQKPRSEMQSRSLSACLILDRKLCVVSQQLPAAGFTVSLYICFTCNALMNALDSINRIYMWATDTEDRKDKVEELLVGISVNRRGFRVNLQVHIYFVFRHRAGSLQHCQVLQSFFIFTLHFTSAIKGKSWHWETQDYAWEKIKTSKLSLML